MFWVYILRSLRNGKLYIGHTNNLDRRVWQHKEGRGSRFTGQNGPWKLVYKEEHPDRVSAVRRERYLKSVAGSREKKRLAGARAGGSVEPKLDDANSVGA